MKAHEMKNIFVITGAPCAGKSSIISDLEGRGFKCLPEESRILIKELLDAKSSLVPWLDLLGFNKMLIQRQIKQYFSAPEGHSFLDRSFVDDIGYLRHSNMSIPDEFFETINKYRFNKTVFFAEPWKEIYVNDEERKEPFDVAVKISDHMKRAYLEAGYEVIPIPKLTIPERTDFILASVGLKKG
jgi:predicted ATPase